MRCRLYTFRGELGTLELADGLTHRDVFAAVQEHRLFVSPVQETTLPAAAAGNAESVNAPGGDVRVDPHEAPDAAARPAGRRRGGA